MKKLLIPIVLISVIGATCKKKQECPTFWGTLLPQTFYFVIKSNGNRLPDSILNSLKLAYFKINSKVYVSDFGRAGSDGYNLGAMITRDIGFRSGDDNIKDFYLEFPNGDIDTLFVDYKRLTACEASTNACQCLYPRNAVKYNGVDANYDPDITTQTVFLFNKR